MKKERFEQNCIPPGFPFSSELTYFTMGSLCAALYSLRFVLDYWNARCALFRQNPLTGEWVLEEGARVFFRDPGQCIERVFDSGMQYAVFCRASLSVPFSRQPQYLPDAPPAGSMGAAPALPRGAGVGDPDLRCGSRNAFSSLLCRVSVCHPAGMSVTVRRGIVW